MLQSPLPPPGPDSINVPVPDAFEQWRDVYLHSGAQKLLVLLLFALVLYLAVRVARRRLAVHVDDVNRRHLLRKWLGYLYFLALIAFAVALFADVLEGLGTLVAVLLAGIAVALQDVLRSLVGWLYLSGRSGIEPGSRIQVEGVMGDVIDIGVLKTTVLEVGNLVYGMQSSGRLVTIPNYRMITDNVVISGRGNPFLWHEIRVMVTYESDWRRAEQILRAVGDELYAEIEPELESGFRGMERRYAFKYGTLTPIVYVTLADSGVNLTLRFLSHVRRRRGAEDRVSRSVLMAFDADPAIELAYPTYRMYRAGEGEGDR